jgi:hypothetical protein
MPHKLFEIRVTERIVRIKKWFQRSKQKLYTYCYPQKAAKKLETIRADKQSTDFLGPSKRIFISGNSLFKWTESGSHQKVTAPPTKWAHGILKQLFWTVEWGGRLQPMQRKGNNQNSVLAAPDWPQLYSSPPPPHPPFFQLFSLLALAYSHVFFSSHTATAIPFI